ncbi:MAG: dual specificity protein phosphatase family protein [Actinomycetota bacterium]|nr:dual specificity protein phosphatase family protein [Actinomycetota bacterium]
MERVNQALGPNRKPTQNSVTVFLLMLACVSCAIITDNFHEITPVEAYRSAQLDSQDLQYYIKKYGIKSVLDLRGPNHDSSWYQKEIKVCQKNKITHFDVSLSATSGPTAGDVRQLMQIFQYAPRPILLHCKAGADRSGLVAAMWKVLVDKEPKEQAQKELSIVYGHIPHRGTEAMDRFSRKWRPEIAH